MYHSYWVIYVIYPPSWVLQLELTKLGHRPFDIYTHLFGSCNMNLPNWDIGTQRISMRAQYEEDLYIVRTIVEIIYTTTPTYYAYGAPSEG